MNIKWKLARAIPVIDLRKMNKLVCNREDN